jgi:hypothetical protein
VLIVGNIGAALAAGSVTSALLAQHELNRTRPLTMPENWESSGSLPN